jgi:hypothetical protein
MNDNLQNNNLQHDNLQQDVDQGWMAELRIEANNSRTKLVEQAIAVAEEGWQKAKGMVSFVDPIMRSGETGAAQHKMIKKFEGFTVTPEGSVSATSARHLSDVQHFVSTKCRTAESVKSDPYTYFIKTFLHMKNTTECGIERFDLWHTFRKWCEFNHPQVGFVNEATFRQGLLAFDSIIGGPCTVHWKGLIFNDAGKNWPKILGIEHLGENDQSVLEDFVRTFIEVGSEKYQSKRELWLFFNRWCKASYTNYAIPTASRLTDHIRKLNISKEEDGFVWIGFSLNDIAKTLMKNTEKYKDCWWDELDDTDTESDDEDSSSSDEQASTFCENKMSDIKVPSTDTTPQNPEVTLISVSEMGSMPELDDATESSIPELEDAVGCNHYTEFIQKYIVADEGSKICYWQLWYIFKRWSETTYPTEGLPQLGAFVATLRKLHCVTAEIGVGSMITFWEGIKVNHGMFVPKSHMQSENGFCSCVAEIDLVAEFIHSFLELEYKFEQDKRELNSFFIRWIQAIIEPGTTNIVALLEDAIRSTFGKHSEGIVNATSARHQKGVKPSVLEYENFWCGLTLNFVGRALIANTYTISESSDSDEDSEDSEHPALTPQHSFQCTTAKSVKQSEETLITIPDDEYGTFVNSYIKLNKKLRVNRHILWPIFVNWYRLKYPGRAYPHDGRLIKTIQEMGEVHKYDGYLYGVELDRSTEHYRVSPCFCDKCKTDSLCNDFIKLFLVEDQDSMTPKADLWKALKATYPFNDELKQEDLFIKIAQQMAGSQNKGTCFGITLNEKGIALLKVNPYDDFIEQYVTKVEGGIFDKVELWEYFSNWCTLVYPQVEVDDEEFTDKMRQFLDFHNETYDWYGLKVDTIELDKLFGNQSGETESETEKVKPMDYRKQMDYCKQFIEGYLAQDEQSSILEPMLWQSFKLWYRYNYPMTKCPNRPEFRKRVEQLLGAKVENGMWKGIKMAVMEPEFLVHLQESQPQTDACDEFIETYVTTQPQTSNTKSDFLRYFRAWHRYTYPNTPCPSDDVFNNKIRGLPGCIDLPGYTDKEDRWRGLRIEVQNMGHFAHLFEEIDTSDNKDDQPPGLVGNESESTESESDEPTESEESTDSSESTEIEYIVHMPEVFESIPVRKPLVSIPCPNMDIEAQVIAYRKELMRKQEVVDDLLRTITKQFVWTEKDIHIRCGLVYEVDDAEGFQAVTKALDLFKYDIRSKGYTYECFEIIYQGTWNERGRYEAQEGEYHYVGVEIYVEN